MRQRFLAMHVVLALLLGAAGCQGTRAPFYRTGRAPAAPAPEAAPSYTVFLIGDAGAASEAPLAPTLRLLRRQLRAADSNAAVVFLGDNAYPRGLPPRGAAGRADAERPLRAQFKAVEGFPGRVFFLPGNHDWNDGEKGGWAAVRRQARFVEAHLRRQGTRGAFLPNGGCPGPATVDLPPRGGEAPGVRLVVLDTQWWIHPYDKPTPANADCRLASSARFAGAVDSVLQAAGRRRLLVAAHHPVYSNGRHGGFFPPQEHLFPLADLADFLYLPLPVVGSVLPFYRQQVGYRQDLAGYADLREALLGAFRSHPGLVYAAGHDHSLQYHPVGGQHYLVSGAGSKTSYAAGGGTAAFSYAHRGFMVLRYYADGAVRLSAWIPTAGEAQGRAVFSRTLQPPVAAGAPPPLER